MTVKSRLKCRIAQFVLQKQKQVMKGIFRCTMGKGTQNKRTYGTPWVHQKEARASEIDQLRKTEDALTSADYSFLETAAKK